MSDVVLKDYHCDYDATKNYWKVLIRDGKPTQGREINNIQDHLAWHIAGIGNALFTDGDIMDGADIVVDQDTGAVTAEAGQIYLKGAVRPVPESRFQIPLTGTVSVGVYLRQRVVTEMEDVSLRNPAPSSRGMGEPGAGRLEVTPHWGHSGDGGTGDFVPVHAVDDGVVRSKEPPPNLDAWRQALAAYDRASTGGGSYIAEGLVVHSGGTAETGAQVYTVSEGEARVNGHGVVQRTSRRLSYFAEPDLRLIDTEVHTADSTGSQRVDVAHPPIRLMQSIRVTRKETRAIVHGAYSGAADTLPRTSVVEILECRQGDTVFVAGTDYKKTGDTVDWGPIGNEPAPGSTYYCTYTFIDSATPEDMDFDGFTVQDAVAGTNIIITYQQALPRRDCLCLTQDGAYTWIKGVAAEHDPRDPVTPGGILPLATVLQTWRDAVSVANDGSRSMSFDEIKAIKDLANYCLGEVARTRLESSANTREAGAKVGLFVDPLIDDSMRDQGLEQSASVFGGEMTLSIKPSIHSLQFPQGLPVFPALVPVPGLSQLLRTNKMQVNPYHAFKVLPLNVELNPAIDRWTENQSVWTSGVTQTIGSGSLTSTRTTTQVVGTTTTSLEYLRSIAVAFKINGMGAGEILDKVVFDGIEVPFTPNEIVADSTGFAQGSFKIPASIPAGAKTVNVYGRGGTFGTGVFVGQGTLAVQTLRSVTTITHSNPIISVDPVAQTFALEADTMMCGVDLWFTAKGGEVRVQLREMDNGWPTKTVLAQGALQPDKIVVTGGGHTRILFDTPVLLAKETEYALVVLCNDAETEVSIAVRKEFDPYMQQHVTAQPYTVGLLLSSSNASTWTTHQDADLTFRLLEASFAPGVHEVNMGSVNVTDATDLVLYAIDENPTAETRVEYEITLPGGTGMVVASGQTARLSAPVTGAVSVKAKLYATQKAAPLLWPDAQLFAGSISEMDDYLSRSITARNANRAMLIYDAFIPSGASVIPEIQIDSGEWRPMELTGTVIQGDKIVEYTHKTDLELADLVKVRFTLVGNTAARPSVRNIRFMAVQ